MALFFTITLPLLWKSLAAAPATRVDVGAWGDQAYLTGVNDPEDSSIETYRWTRAHATLDLPNFGGRKLLRIRAHGWRPPGENPPKVHILVSGQLLTTLQTSILPRTYTIALPYDHSSPNVHIEFVSELAAKIPDQRELGFALDWISLEPLDEQGPAIGQFGAQALLLLLALLLIHALKLPPIWAIVSAIALIGALLGANSQQPLWVSTALAQWLTIGALLLGATWLLRSRFICLLAPWMHPIQASIAWALFIATLALRLLGETHPLFDIHDLTYHKNWLADVTSGQLYISVTPAEIHNYRIFYLPASYILLMPLGLLVPSARLVIQIGLGFVDAIGALFLLGLGQELGLPSRARLLAVSLYAALPINMTMLWWGFTTNALAQSVGLLLFWLLLRVVDHPSPGRQAIFGAACAVSMLMHIGALVLMGATVCASIVLGWRQLKPIKRVAAVRAGGLALACTALLYFSAAASFAGSQSQSGRSTLHELIDQFGTRLELMRLGLLRGFLGLPLALAPLGLLSSWRLRPQRPFGHILLASWLAVGLLFFCIYLGLGLVVRHLYFLAPLVCLSVGVLLNKLWRRNGKIIAITIVLLVAWVGTALWINGVLRHIKPSGVPLVY